MTDTPRVERSFDSRIFRATVIVLSTAGAAYLLWRLVDLLLLLFACALIALILVTIANLIRRKLPMPYAAALTLAVLAITVVLVGAFWFFGATMTAQFSELIARLPGAWTALQGRLAQSAAGAQLLARMREFAPSSANIVGWLTSALSIGGGILSGLAVVIVGGLYLAAQPGLYGGGLVRLIPRRGQAESIATFEAIAAALRGWLKGQALGMVFVGVGVSIGLAIVGLPAALAIGLVAGLAEFVPYLGTIVAVIPAVILGFSQGTDTGLWTIAVMLGVQQIQGNLVMPLLQKSMVDLPPALTIFGLIAAGILFGPVGVLLATPLTVVALVLVRRLYLGDDTPLGGEAKIEEPALDPSPGAPPRTKRLPRRSTRSGSPSPS
jgi:predicted PurR-regulated permease PerM